MISRVEIGINLYHLNKIPTLIKQKMVCVVNILFKVFIDTNKCVTIIILGDKSLEYSH